MSRLLYVNSIIERALKTVRAVSNSQAQDNDKADALDLLNELLAEFSATGSIIPFQIVQTFTLRAGKSKYTIGELDGVDVQTTPFAVVDYVNLIIDGVRFNVTVQDDFAILGHAMSENITSRPGWVRITRAATYSLLEFYGTPDRDYVCEIYGKKESGQIEFKDNIELPDWYTRYLRLALARELNSMFDLKAWDASDEQRYQEAKISMEASSQKDWAIETSAPFGRNTGLSTYRLGVISR